MAIKDILTKGVSYGDIDLYKSRFDFEKFEIEDYCKDNDIDYNIIASEVDSIRYSVKIENLDKKSKDFYDDKQKRTNGTSKHIHFQDDSSRA